MLSGILMNITMLEELMDPLTLSVVIILVLTAALATFTVIRRHFVIGMVIGTATLIGVAVFCPSLILPSLFVFAVVALYNTIRE